jgi:hypothetical protein
MVKMNQKMRMMKYRKECLKPQIKMEYKICIETQLNIIYKQKSWKTGSLEIRPL